MEMEMETATRHTGKASIWRLRRSVSRSFLYLWACTVFTGLAFSMYLLTETWYVVQRLGQDQWLGLVLMMTTIPRVLFMAAGGVLADRIRSSQIMTAVNGCRGLITAGMAVLLLWQQLPIGAMMAFALAFGTLDAFFWPARSSLIPRIVEKESLVRANAAMQTTNQLSFMIGPAVAGFLLKYGSYSLCLGIVAACLLISGGLSLRIRERAVDSDKPRHGFWRELKEGVAYVRRMPYLLVVMGTTVIVNLLLAGPLNAGLPLLVKTTLKGDVLALSWLESALAGGMLAGAVLAGICNFRRKRSVISLALIGLLGIFIAFLSQIGHLWQGLLLLALSGIVLSVSNVIAPAVSQQMVEPDMMGRVQSLMATSSFGLMPISYALVAFLLSIGAPITTLMLVSALGIAAFVGLILGKVKIVWAVD